MNKILNDQISQQLFESSCVYYGDFKELGWNHKHTQRSPVASNCRFHTEHVLKAIDALGYELKEKSLRA